MYNYNSIYININSSVLGIDKRISNYDVFFCLNSTKNIALKYVNENDFSTLNESLKILDFIVIGDTNFHQKIKDIENNFAHKKIFILPIIQMKLYIILIAKNILIVEHYLMLILLK